jgi:putative membrane protein
MVGEKGIDKTPPTKGRATSDTTSDTAIRDHLANKRTMLAWARTGIAVMALGFVVSRFGLLLRELRLTTVRLLPEGVSTVFGATLVAIGGLAIILATLDYLRTGHAIDRHTYHWSPALEFALSLLLVLAAVVLAIYLVLTS